MNTTLNGLLGHLVIETTSEKKELERLGKLLSQSAIETGPRSPIKKEFKFEKSDLFFEDKIVANQKKLISGIVKNRAKPKVKTQYKVFRREAPIREHLLHHSIADWAVGARVDHSIGPFKNKDGRQYWFDFFPIEKLIALYFQGDSQPALLFKVKQGGRLSETTSRTLTVALTKTYTLSKGSIWIRSKFLAPNAPADSYTGLTISSGKVSLSTIPKKIGGKLTVPGSTTVTVDLKLSQPQPTDADPSSPYGQDARKLVLRLPDTLKFHFSANGRTIDQVSNANWALYGQKMAFSWEKSIQTNYDASFKRIAFAFKASSQDLIIQQSNSEFNKLDNQAEINLSAWVLPVATIDISQPIAAEGIGEMLVICKSGISSSWTGLQSGGLALSNPGFIVGPGQIFLIDLKSGNPHASQSLDLWKDELNPFGTKVHLNFSSDTPFYYASNANGNELLMAFTNANFEIDRPVQVNGEPPQIRSLNSLLLIAVGNTGRLIYLLDDNLILDDAEISNEDPIIPDQMAFAITNALFKVLQPNSCLLFGSLSEDFKKVDKGFLFLTFGLLAYLPTLPDPYAANLGILKRQIRGNLAGSAVGTTAVTGQQFTAWLVCRIAWEASTEDPANDLVEVSFHFAPLNSPFAGISFEAPEDDETEEVAELDSSSAAVPDLAVQPNLEVSANINTPLSVLTSDIANAPASGTSTRASTEASTRSGDDVNVTAPSFPTAAVFNPDLPPLPEYEDQWDKNTSRYRRDLFALLDVSSNADLFGISFDLLTRKGFRVSNAVDPTTGEQISSLFPIQVDGMEVVSAGANVKAFTVPQISWEPVFNLTPQVPPPDGPIPGDPDWGFNYYPDDGGPTHILNNSEKPVALAPLPVTDFLVEKRASETEFRAFSFFTLPFGMKAVALLQDKYASSSGNQRDGGDLKPTDIQFQDDINSGLQLRMTAGLPLREGDSDMFMGSTVQINNILNIFGAPTGNSTLGGSVSTIFNKEFFNDPNYPFELFKQRGVPVTQMDLSGYGASMFSDWQNTKAAIAETSQAKFDVFVGRCGHEVIQVKSIMYPWAIKVVRTITLFRVGSGYVYRFDSGWKAETNGKFDFRYSVFETNPDFPGGTPDNPEPELVSADREAEFEIHPGLVRGLYNVSNILETTEVEAFKGNFPFTVTLDPEGKEAGPGNLEVDLQPVYFDTDIEVDGALSGVSKKNTSEGEKELVSSKRVLGFVQLGPRGVPLSKEALKQLVLRQASIGGPIDCEVDLAGSTQKMRFNRFDFSNSFETNGSSPVFAVAGRGNVLLPKDGSWTMVKHERSSGEVSPVSADLSIPVIKQGRVVISNDKPVIENIPGGTLTRIAEPTELFRQPVDSTVNYGFLQSTDTQKALFLTPSFKEGDKKLLSKTPPLFVDAFRIVNTKGIFPNIGLGDDFSLDTLGEAVLMKKGGNLDYLVNSSLQDLGQDVFELMDIQDTIDGVKQQGLKLLHNPEQVFDLPTEFVLIDTGDGNFKVYIEYATQPKDDDPGQKGDLEFDIDSLAKSWKGKMNNIGLVIDLAGIERLMTIRGKWDSENGKESTYPEPDLQFSPELQPLIDLLEILQSLQKGNYGDAVASGLKLAMSNKAGSWEYKFEASKEIPVIRFPVPDAVYNDPNTPFKLEAGLSIGAYFNAALKVTTDANELLPSAGASLGFYARLSVMCVSISAATIYAIGQANVDIAADTKIGPSLRMKFGFGAQIVIGLPVAGNVSVLFVVGAEIFIAEGIFEISAFMLFEGHAEILGGIVSITIRIEAKGTYTKKQIGSGSRTDLECQVTFGLDISIAFIINISFTESWSEQRQIA